MIGCHTSLLENIFLKEWEIMERIIVLLLQYHFPT